ncbi:MAG: hypothetical protein AUH85_08330 [Chloroflexi bacterium 13_1_40CM_4_68_4]|nr:MAG: hypothetical protein AUH85_08330 [Chloroflexi bacterium 13_1_40CM_4_68_4]
MDRTSEQKPLAAHHESAEIESLAEAAERTDERALRRSLFGWREAISIVIPVVLVIYVARNVDWPQTLATLEAIDLRFLVAALAVYYASFPLRSWRWSLLLAQGSERRPGGLRLLVILMLGWFVNAIVPAKLGDLYRSYLVKRNFGVSLSRTVGVVVSERVLDLVVAFALMVLGGYIAFGRELPVDSLFVFVSAAVLAALMAAGFVVIYALAPRLERFFPTEMARVVGLFREGVLHSFRALPLAGVLTVLIWLAEAGHLFFVVHGLGLDLRASGVIFVAVAASILTAVPLTPAGFGFVEIAMVVLLTGVFGFAQHDAVAVAVVDRSVSVFSLLVVGGILYVREQRSLRDTSRR